MFNFFRKNSKNTTPAQNAAQKKDSENAKSSLPVILQSVVVAAILNIREEPDSNARIVGKITKNTIVSIFKIVNDDWFMIKYNNKECYISSKFVKPLKGYVNANILNVRDQPASNSNIIAKLTKNEIVEIIMRLPDWYKINYKSHDAYVSAKFITFENIETENPHHDVNVDLLKNRSALMRIKLEPEEKIEIPKEPRENKIVAQTYNNYGGFLRALSNEINIDIATAIAVIAVESAGKAYSDSGNVIIRFENHLFYRYWGEKNKNTYDKYFSFDSAKKWETHKFRKDESAEWKVFHGDQDAEWEVLQFARTLDNDAALISASYGAPQILGSNFKKIGYMNAEDMLFYFGRDIKYQIFALFDFLNPQMIQHLQNKNFKDFAGIYNGKGQEERYGDFIRKSYEAFKQINLA